MSSFDSKTFNPQAFGAYSETVPKKRLNLMIKANIFKRNKDIADVLKTQTGSFYAVIPMYGRIGGEPDNYDGKTDINSSSMTTYSRGVVAFGRAKGFTEKDFSYDITSGVDFMSQVAAQVQEYWDNANEDTLISIIKGVFAMTSKGGLEFINKHTFDITSKEDGKVTETTLNDALQQSSGDKKNVFSLTIMNSSIATSLENKKLLKYLTYTTPEGLEMPLNIGFWNGKLVLVDDSITTEVIEATYAKSTDSSVQPEKTYYTLADGVYTEVAEPTGNPSESDYYEKTADEKTQYVTYAFGEGAFDYEPLDVKVPYEMDRDPAKNGGEDTLYSRERIVYAPHGISFTNKNVASFSPTNAEFEDGANWDIVSDADGAEYFDHKEIPIVRIISLG